MRYLVCPIVIFFLPLCWSKDSIADKNCPANAGAKLDSLQGKVFVDPSKIGQWHPAQQDEFICEGSRIRVENYSRASITLTNGVVLRLDEGTVLSLNGISPDKPTLLDLLNGFIHFISRTPKHLEITSPIANAGPEGTEFAMHVDDKKASLWVYEGAVKFFNDKGTVHLTPGQGAEALLGQAPKTQINIKPQDAVNWALYYPPILPYPESLSTVDPEIRKAIQDFRQGHVDDALIKLDAVSPEKRSPYFFKVRAAIRLTAGRVPLAQQDIQVIQITHPNDAEALALQSVMALTQNRKEEALALANRAIASDPHSASAYSALSYAEQARFQLDKALDAADQAVKIAPHDAMVWARKAELELSKGLTSESQKTAQHALELDADLERTQSVIGFSYLLRMDTDEALQAFEKAVKFDSTSSLARLGLGLAKIRNGDLKRGRQDLEIAAILDPNNSLVRSYLGKAYYEESRSSLAEDQFTLAKERDPKDPTPYFYDAINKQTTNRPVEALHDMQKAIELNDNRGIYRSKLLLENDSAARSASLGRIYNDLGFQQRGLLEGWRSINIDPSNYSAHRLLSDNYISLPRHEIARVSELLKAQLLQSINITPVQPQTAESNILIFDGLGSSITSFNEYNPLFTGNRFALQASGFFGGNNTKSDEVVHSGVWNKFSYSLGQFHYGTSGYRDNNEHKKDLYNLFTQFEIYKDTSAQIELRRSEQQFGDINQGFFNDIYSLLTKGLKIENIIRGGFHHKFNENADLLMSIIHKDEKSKGVDYSQGIEIDYSNKALGTQYELQDMYRNKDYDLTIGINYLVNQNNNFQTSFLNPFINFNFNVDSETEHKAFYIYSNIKKIPKLIITAGLSQDFYNQKNLQTQFEQTQTTEISRNPFNPKFGLTWTPTKDTTLRFAAFRSLKRGIIQKQTLEPTQIAGFNQFFDDTDGSIARRIGFGLDHKFSSKIFWGAEISERFIDVPFFQNAINLRNTKWSERNLRIYLNLIPNDIFSFGVSYGQEKFTRNRDFFDSTNSNFFTNLYTHRTQLFGNYYHPLGFISKINLEYINQSGEFLNPIAGSLFPGASSFWLLDAQIGYRFQKRHGLISLGIRNLLDNRFNFQGTDLEYPELPKARFFFSRLTLSF